VTFSEDFFRNLQENALVTDFNKTLSEELLVTNITDQVCLTSLEVFRSLAHLNGHLKFPNFQLSDFGPTSKSFTTKIGVISKIELI